MSEKRAIGVRLSSESLAWVERKSAAHGKTTSEVIREAIDAAKTQEALIARLEKLEIESAKTLEKIDQLGRMTSEIGKRILAKLDEQEG